MKMTSMLMGTVFGLPQINFAPDDGGGSGGVGGGETGGSGEGGSPSGGETGGSGSETGGGQQGNDAWYSGLPEADQGWLQNRGLHEKPVTDAVAETIKSYRNLESRMGVPSDRLLKLPEKLEGEEMAAVYDRLGRPEKPDSYEFKPPENVELDDGFTDWAKNTFHKYGLNQEQAQGLLSEYLQYEMGASDQANSATEEQLQQQAETLKKEWGAAYDQNLSSAKRAARELGMSAEELDALDSTIGYDRVMKMFNSIGEKIMEPGFHDNPRDGGPGGMGGKLTPQQAMDRINELKQDAGFRKKYTEGDADARQKMAYLHQMAYPDDNQPLTR